MAVSMPPVSSLLLRISKALGFRMDREPREVLRVLEEELAGTGNEAEWDELISVKDANPQLEAIRATIPADGRHTDASLAALGRSIAAVRRYLDETAI
jgi:hypothetical protein